jgi:ubiquinone/menaquinone biosynthesis C-methylase UbiE
MTSTRSHWENVYAVNNPERVGWYQENPAVSLRLISACSQDPGAPIIDIGGGCSHLAERLLERGHYDITVLDLSGRALALARDRLGPKRDRVKWVVGNVIAHEFSQSYAIWHDRAVFHFLTDEADQERYVAALGRVVVSGGHAIVATFAPDGPERCSGLPVQRYGEESLSRRLGGSFEPIWFEREIHLTPSGVEQRYLFGHFRRF